MFSLPILERKIILLRQGERGGSEGGGSERDKQADIGRERESLRDSDSTALRHEP